jgi:hypothetical protein
LEHIGNIGSKTSQKLPVPRNDATPAHLNRANINFDHSAPNSRMSKSIEALAKLYNQLEKLDLELQVENLKGGGTTSTSTQSSLDDISPSIHQLRADAQRITHPEKKIQQERLSFLNHLDRLESKVAASRLNSSQPETLATGPINYNCGL